jgi:hypothetical protein
MNTAHKIVSMIFILLIFSMILVSCDDSSDDDLEGMTRISKTSGDNRTERVGAALPQPMVVRVTDLVG